MSADEPEEIPGVKHAETTDVAERGQDLAALLRPLRTPEGRLPADAVAALPAGGLLGLPPLERDVWVDIAGAGVLAGVAPKTITSWLARRGPRRNPFPPAHRYLYRLYWPAHVVLDWRATEDTES